MEPEVPHVHQELLLAMDWRPTSVILTTWGPEIRRIEIKGNLGK
jgi:hypothetical protein